MPAALMAARLGSSVQAEAKSGQSYPSKSARDGDDPLRGEARALWAEEEDPKNTHSPMGNQGRGCVGAGAGVVPSGAPSGETCPAARAAGRCSETGGTPTGRHKRDFADARCGRGGAGDVGIPSIAWLYRAELSRRNRLAALRACGKQRSCIRCGWPHLGGHAFLAASMPEAPSVGAGLEALALTQHSAGQRLHPT